jgi:hypothetical protein
MEPTGSAEMTSGAREQESRPTAVRVSVVWGRVVLGFLLSAIGGVAFGHAWTVQVATWWWVGAVSLLAGALLLLSVVYARGRD